MLGTGEPTQWAPDVCSLPRCKSDLMGSILLLYRLIFLPFRIVGGVTLAQ